MTASWDAEGADPLGDVLAAKERVLRDTGLPGECYVTAGQVRAIRRDLGVDLRDAAVRAELEARPGLQGLKIVILEG